MPTPKRKTQTTTPTRAKKTPHAQRKPSARTKPTASRAETTAEKKSALGVPEETPSAGLGLVRRCVDVLNEKKAADVEVVFLGEKSPVTDYFVIATGTSEPHLRALRVALEKAIHEVVPAAHVRVQNEPGSGWCVVDAFDVVVHLFLQDRRETYALEDLWKDGERILPARGD